MKDPVILVSGLPRSGTSMMMKMLGAGGVEILTDNIRKADGDNPEGYYEVEQVKELYKNARWLHHARGKAVKVISSLLYHLPMAISFKVIFMQREIPEVLASQQKMLGRLGETDGASDAELTQKYEEHLQKIAEWITKQRHIDCLYVNYKDVVNDPEPWAEKIREFLGMPLLELEKMAVVVKPELYRNRV
ncbi:MAG: sulfotransferase [bacterium]|nr:sulfotransferase [bacterium]